MKWFATIRDAKDRDPDFLPTRPDLSPDFDPIVSEMVLMEFGYPYHVIQKMSFTEVISRQILAPVVRAMNPKGGLFG